MSTFAPFINAQYLKDNSPLASNMDIKLIYPYIKTAQNITIQETLGTLLYDRLMDSLNASPSDTTANETILLKWIREAMVWLTPYHAIPFIWVNIRNIGLVQQSGTDMTSADKVAMEKLRQECLDNATFYIKRLKDYLCDNSDLFSQYTQGCWGCENMPANTSIENSSDIYFDKNTNEKPSYLRFIPKP